jgi:3-deoxy-D-manno-octulosonic-acid transferase
VFSIFIYNLSIFFYQLAVKVAAPFSSKALAWIDGRKNLPDWNKLTNKKGKRIWFHCASLGEFEQARPLIEKFRNDNKEHAILLTFFSPSGYEIRKNYEAADLVAYLPLDTAANAEAFIGQAKPDLVFFVKYEFWYHYLATLKKNRVPVVLFSAVFRKQQVFFKWYGSLFRNMLQNFTTIFVQNEESKALLQTININSTVAFDTRFDRVYQIAGARKTFAAVEKFKGDKKILIAGSTWPADEELLIPFILNNSLPGYKFIIAPHQIEAERMHALYAQIKQRAVRFSELNETNALTAEVLLIDNMGNLASLYAYGDIAYIGGGFNASVHNVLEATVYGIPVLFGPNYKKAEEAKELVKANLAFEVTSYAAITEKIRYAASHLVTDQLYKLNMKSFVEKRLGGTEQIFAATFNYLKA